jgi:transcriptional regulator with XRE-family HTH domain
VVLPEWAQRVAALRKELGLKQVDFAAKFGVTQAAISRWERGAKEPSAEIYIRMGNIAAKPACFWFLEKAGLDVSRLRSLFLEEKPRT